MEKKHYEKPTLVDRGKLEKETAITLQRVSPLPDTEDDNPEF